MTTNPFFNFHKGRQDQILLDNLLIESIRQMGMDMYYMPARRTNFDQLFYEDDQLVYDKAYVIETYLKADQGGFGSGMMSLFTKFGPEVRDQYKFCVSRTRFAQEVTSKQPEILRPREGDLMYFTLNKKAFKIDFTENKPFFYQLGELQLFDMTCTNFVYSNEKFDTGIDEIDQIQLLNTTNMLDYAVKDANGDFVVDSSGDFIINDEYATAVANNDPLRDNEFIEANTSIIDWTERNPFANNGTY